MLSIKKKLITCTLAVAMAMGAQAVPVNATTITTDVKSILDIVEKVTGFFKILRVFKK